MWSWEKSMNDLCVTLSLKCSATDHNSILKVCQHSEELRDAALNAIRQCEIKKQSISEETTKGNILKALKTENTSEKHYFLNQAFKSGLKREEIYQLRIHLLYEEKKFKLCWQEVNELKKLNPKSTFLKKLKFLEKMFGQAKKRLRSLNSEEIIDYQEGFEENNLFPSASHAISLVYSEEKGRHVISNRPISKASVLFIEDPFAFVIGDEFSELICHHCCCEIVTLYQCETCNLASYCGPMCLSQAKTVHKYECPGMNLFRQVGAAFLALKIVVKQGSYSDLNRFLLSEKCSQPRDRATPTGYEGVYHLTVPEKLPKDDLLRYAMTSYLLATYLQAKTDYLKDSIEWETTYRTVFRHILQLICNAHAISRHCALSAINSQLISDFSTKRIGSAVYPAISMLNHSCEPDIQICFDKCRLIVRALHDIETHSEILNSYVPTSKHLAREKRRAYLKNQYSFDCQCAPCLEPFDFMDRRTALKCPDCPGPLVFSEARLGICIDCRKKYPISGELREKYSHFNSIKMQAVKADEKKSEKTLDFALKAWFVGREILYPFNKDLMELADMMAKHFALSGLFTLAIAILKTCLRAVEFTFGPDSTEFALEMEKIGLMVMDVDSKDSYGKELLQRAAQILKLWLGPEYDVRYDERFDLTEFLNEYAKTS